MFAADKKGTQRERLLDAMVHCTAQEGYLGTTVAKVIARAGVSRPTFYDYFTNKDDCFLAALAQSEQRASAAVERALSDAPADRAAATTIGSLIAFANSEPAHARVLFSEALAGRAGALDSRDRWIDSTAGLIEDAYAKLPPTARLPDLSSAMLIGGICRLLCARLRRYSEPNLAGLNGDLLTWLSSYEQPLRAHRWRTLKSIPVIFPLPRFAALIEPPRLSPGRPRLARAQLEEIHRRRILFAAARTSERKGYAATRIADINELAGVQSATFHQLFSDTHEVFMALHELYFQHVMAVMADVYFKGGSWAERVWAGGLAFGQCIEQDHALAHAAFVESHTSGPITSGRVEEMLSALTLFLLRDGHDERGPWPAGAPFQLALEAIAATSFEIAYRQTRKHLAPAMTGLLPHVSFLYLAPFIGPTGANGFIEEQLRSS